MQPEDLVQTFSALGDKTRFHLFQLLAEREAICVSQLANRLGITPACVSQHMKVLADAGLVSRIREGQRVCYQINTDSSVRQTLNNLIFKSSTMHIS